MRNIFFKKFWTNTLDRDLGGKVIEERAGEDLRRT
jgi:hypothetical protein